MTTDAARLESAWRLAESRGMPGSDAIAADPIDVVINQSQLMAGVDDSGVRHLLIPIPAAADVPAYASGPGISLRKRALVLDGHEATYIDLACLRPDLFYEFALLASDVVDAVNTDQAHAPDAVVRVLKAWRELLQAVSGPRLDRTSMIGLYAELSFLQRIVALDPRRSVESWTGPSRGRYDFERGEIVLEVKGSVARRGRPIVVHGLDQLELPPNASLYLCWMRLEFGIERGESLRDIVNHLLDLTLQPADLEQKLRNVGYDFANEELYERPLLTELEARLYLVDQTFPALTRADLVGGELPHGVVSVSYQLDLSGDEPATVPREEEVRTLMTLAGLA